MGKTIKILLIEDSENDAELLLHELRRGGYDPVHKRVETEEGLRTAIEQETWDLVTCDHTMPQFNSTAALGLLRARELDVPLIIVSGTITEEAAVAAMKAGAQDYLLKGHLQRLVPAVERELN